MFFHASALGSCLSSSIEKLNNCECVIRPKVTMRLTGLRTNFSVDERETDRQTDRQTDRVEKGEDGRIRMSSDNTFTGLCAQKVTDCFVVRKRECRPKYYDSVILFNNLDCL